ncbi:MAG TPA: carbohydrate kinase [Burkholderiaceae bacterium]
MATIRRIACFGEALIDFRAPYTEDAGAGLPFLRNAGGAPANVAVALARLGMSSSFVGMLRTDMFGDFLLDHLAAAGVDTRYVVRTRDASTALTFAPPEPHLGHGCHFRRHPTADLLFTEAHFQDGCFDGLAAFHVCSNSLTEAPIAAATLAGMRRARAAGALVSFDLNLRPAQWPRDTDPLPRLWQALALADLVKLSAEERDYLAAAEGGAAAMRLRLWQGHARVLVVSDGARPLSWHLRDGRGTIPVPHVEALDTTGAGDAFMAGLLARLIKQGVTPATLDDAFLDPARRIPALRNAAACGALAVTRLGAFAGMPTRANLDAFLNLRA